MQTFARKGAQQHVNGLFRHLVTAPLALDVFYTYVSYLYLNADISFLHRNVIPGIDA